MFLSQSCASGFYRNTSDLAVSVLGSCQSCPCNGNEESCSMSSDQRVTCYCKPGYSGRTCDNSGSPGKYWYRLGNIDNKAHLQHVQRLSLCVRIGEMNLSHLACLLGTAYSLFQRHYIISSYQEDFRKEDSEMCLKVNLVMMCVLLMLECVMQQLKILTHVFF